MAKRGIYSRDLGIELCSGKERELFKSFLACLFFGKPVQQKVARRTHLEFAKEGLVTCTRGMCRVENNLRDGRCPTCRTVIAGVWE